MSDRLETLNVAYWEGFLTLMRERYPDYVHRNASKEEYQIVPPTWFSDGIRIAAGIKRTENTIRVDVTLRSNPREQAKEWYRKLHQHKREIERDLGTALWWNERPDKSESHIIFPGHLPLDGARRPQYDWLADNIDRFHQVFGPHIAAFSENS